MAKSLVIVDSCVFIKAFRNDTDAKNDLKKIEGFTAYSIITQLELLVGANTSAKKEAMMKRP
jgi:predicted nucleic acid-binding protein